MYLRSGLVSVFLLVFVLSVFAAHTQSFAKDSEPEFWPIRCGDQNDLSKKDKRGLCEISQTLSVKNDKGQSKRLVEFAIGYPKDKNMARGIFVLPLGIFVEDGLEMQVDNNTPFKFKIRYCDSAGCFAYLNLNDSVLDMMRKGTKITVRFKSIKPQNIEVPLSLKGFTKALSDVS